MGSVSGGAEKDNEVLSDLATVMHGGEDFLSRLSAFDKASQNHRRAAAESKKALADLELGQDLIQAKKDVEAEMARAEEMIQDAGQKAAAILNSARADAEIIKKRIADAEQKAKAAHADASAIHARVTDDIVRQRAELIAQVAEAEAKNKDLDKKLAEQQRLNSALSVERAKLDDERRKHVAKVAALDAALAKVR